jgi:peptidoglycan/LPS O-acetylase OafA/YrhL
MSDTTKYFPSIWPLLGGFRFFLALWVLLAHTSNFTPPGRAMASPSLSGFMPVLCFFVISGFSIRHSIAQRPRGYLWRRVKRIYPINLLAVALTCISVTVFGIASPYNALEVPPSAVDWLINALLLQAIFFGSIALLTPSWSVAIEVVYYALAPLLLRLNLPSVAAIAVATFVFQVILSPHLPPFNFGHTYGIAATAILWVWLIGWIAYSYPRNLVLFGISLAGIWYFVFDKPVNFGVVDWASAAANYLACAATLGVVCFSPNLRLSTRMSETLEYLGEISFPIYLLHYPVFFILTGTVFKSYPDWNNGLFLTVFALCFAMLSYNFIDKPFRRRTPSTD